MSGDFKTDRSSGEALPLQVISEIERLLQSPSSRGLIVGTSTVSALAMLFSHQELRYFHGRPNLIILPRAEDVSRLQTAMNFFDPTIELIPLTEFDVSPYSNLYPSRKSVAQRLYWLDRAQRARPGEIFVASQMGLLQRTLPYEVLAQNTKLIQVGDEWPVQWIKNLSSLGYSASPLVEDVGSYSERGGIFDIFSPANSLPYRIELFGDIVDSIREFDPETQKSRGPIKQARIVPSQEIVIDDERRQMAAIKFNKSLEGRPVNQDDAQSIRHAISHGQFLHGLEFLVSYFYKLPALPSDHFSQELTTWVLDPIEAARAYDDQFAALKYEYEDSSALALRPHYSEFCATIDSLSVPEAKRIEVSRIQIEDTFDATQQLPMAQLSGSEPQELIQQVKSFQQDTTGLVHYLEKKLSDWKAEHFAIFLACSTESQAQRLRLLLERGNLEAQVIPAEKYDWQDWIQAQKSNSKLIHLICRPLPESQRFSDEKLILLREDDVFGRRLIRREPKSSGSLEKRVHALSFGDLKIGDLIVHKSHGIGIYDGLRVMPIQGVEAEFIQLSYKDKDKLYLPIYRVGQIQKYSGPNDKIAIDKLGGTSWEKTKTKVRSHLRDLAADLLKLYAQRSQIHRPPFRPPDDEYLAFESTFPYDETADQDRAIHDVLKDMTSDKPMDRLICGDVGFGKTEIAMRAAFKAVEDQKQVALIAPTTVLTFQHYENLKKRFSRWPYIIKAANRFVPAAELKQTLKDLAEGKVDIIIGTHRLLSKDVQFKNLGLLIVDEEQKFGVLHKERLRKIKTSVDTIALSATPIPRTLNMSLMGLRDLSIINTAPVDRLPTRTFVCKFDGETIKKAVYSEIARGGQIYFIHNRIHSIYELADRLRGLMPDVRMKIAHGQMEEHDLEKAMVAFFNHEIDVLICTAIVESGMDIPKANTMFIDNAHQFGLSQLYQLRGRVGRSKERAYCYLLVPPDKKLDKDAQERLKVIQEASALGSGFKIAHHDLELRGAGEMLGEEQSGHVGDVGYELYLELLEGAIRETKGEPIEDPSPDPEINLRIPALIPDTYIPDIRVRLSYYKALADIESPREIDQIEEDLRDQFGKLPEVVMNLLGVMTIRWVCRGLGIRDLSAGPKSLSLSFTERTPLPAQKVVELASRSNKKYSVTPDNRLNIRMNEITWTRVYDELNYLKDLC